MGTQPGHSLVVLPLTFGGGHTILKSLKLFFTNTQIAMRHYKLKKAIGKAEIFLLKSSNRNNVQKIDWLDW